MSIWDHLGELRRRIIISALAVVIGAAVVFTLADHVFEFFLGYYRDAVGNQEATFIFLGPLDAFTARLKVATYGGIALAMPVWLWQLWRFVTPALNPKEKKYAVPFVLASIVLFVFGALVALFTLPKALEFLLGVGGDSLQAQLTANSFLGLASLMLVAFGVAFEFPILLVFLLLARIISTETLRRRRRWTILIIVIFAAVITPSQDPFSLFAMALPMYLFYEICIIIGRILKR